MKNIFLMKKDIHTNKDDCDQKSAEKFKFVFYMIVWKTKLSGVGFYGSTRSHICTQYMLGVRFVRGCHLALYCPIPFQCICKLNNDSELWNWLHVLTCSLTRLQTLFLYLLFCSRQLYNRQNYSFKQINYCTKTSWFI